MLDSRRRLVLAAAVLALPVVGAVAPPRAAAHASSVAFWQVDVSDTVARSEVLVSLRDFGWTTADLATPDLGGTLSEARRRAIGDQLLRHFTLSQGEVALPATVLDVRLLPQAMIQVTASYARPDTRTPVTVRSTFHVLTDDSHRVMARIDVDGTSVPVMLDARTPEYLAASAAPTRWAHRLAPAGTARAMLLQGVVHIVTGYDHLLFLLCLLVPGGTLWSRVAIVTAFTVAHSVTLVLAALQIVTPPARFIEVAIALSLVYVALENLLHEAPRARWPTAFGFGLVHGFGFAGMLDVIALPTGAFVASVLAFNLGVELGQLAVVLLAVPLLALAARAAWHRRLVQVTSVLVCGLAGWWVVERLR